MTNWELGQYVRVWRGGSVGEHDAGGYEYGHIESIEDDPKVIGTVVPFGLPTDEVMLVGDDGIEIHCQVKDLEEGD